jgi:hypothetical protein
MEKFPTSGPLSATSFLELQTPIDNSDTFSSIFNLYSSGASLWNVSQLPPMDRGRQAWGFVLGGVMIEGLGWGESATVSWITLIIDLLLSQGYLFSFGVFQEFLSSQDTFGANKAISSIGTVAAGTAYMSIPFIQRFVTSPYPVYRRGHMLTGLSICLVGCIAASFLNKVVFFFTFSSNRVI